MTLTRLILLGAAVAAGASILNRKRADGSSLMSDLKEQAPQWMEKATDLTNQLRDQVMPSGNSNNESTTTQY